MAAPKIQLSEEQKRVLSRTAQAAELARLRADAKRQQQAEREKAEILRVATKAAKAAETAEHKARAARHKAEAAALERVRKEQGIGKLRGRPSNNPKGSPKGTLHQIKLDVKTMILGALERAGGVEYLLAQAELNPVAFMSLVGKVLPMQVTGANGGPIEGRVEHVITFVGPGAPAIAASTPRATKRIVDTSISDAVEVVVTQQAEEEARLW